MTINTHDGIKLRVNKDGSYDRRYKDSIKFNAKVFRQKQQYKELNEKLIFRAKIRNRIKKHNKFMFKVLIILFIIAILTVGLYFLLEDLSLHKAKTLIKPVSNIVAYAEEQKLTYKQIICSYDWDCNTALKIVECESHFDRFAINKNTNETYDLGIWQINDIHNISKEDRFDISKSTEHAYKIYQNRGNNFSAWVCANLIGVK